MQGLERPQPSVSTDKATTSSSGDQHDDRNEYVKFLLKFCSVNESDDDVRRVPEMGAQTLLGQSVDSGVAIKGESDPSGPPIPSTSAPTPRKRGRTTADKEHKRLKRLLRNRVSAQQARERKKAYLNDLENRARDLQQRNSELEERISTLQNENFMLRQILKNTTRSKGSGNSEV